MLSLVVAPMPGVVVVWPHGVLDEDASAGLADVLRDLFASESALAVLVDLSEVDRFDLAVVEMFKAAAAVADRGGGTLSVRCASEEAVAALTTCGLGRLVSGAADTTRAVRSEREQAGSRRRHPAGTALRGHGPEMVGPTRTPRRRTR